MEEPEEEPAVEGWLSKRSRHRGVYRDRWIVLSRSRVIAFRDERCYLQPTETIELLHVTGATLDANALTLSTARRAFVFRAPADAEHGAPGLLEWYRQIQALRSSLGVESSLISRLPEDVLARIFEELPTSAIQAISTTCRQWRDVRMELLGRQHGQATARIEHLWSTDAVYHLATLRRHRPLERAFPFFTLHAEHDDELLLRADRDRHGRGFVISAPAGGPVGAGAVRAKAHAAAVDAPMQYVAHLVGNSALTAFVLYDHGLPPPCPRLARAAAQPQPLAHAAEYARGGAAAGDASVGGAAGAHASARELERAELAHVTLRSSMWAARCIAVALPAQPAAGAAGADGEVRVVREEHAAASAVAPSGEPWPLPPAGEPWPLPSAGERALRSSSDERRPCGAPAHAAVAMAAPRAHRRTLASRMRRQQWRLGADSSISMLHNAVPAWNSELRAFTLPFYGRVHLASKKNFQLIDRRRPDVIVMIFGKKRRDVYSLDWCAPLSCVQALGVALSSFDSCLSGAKL